MASNTPSWAPGGKKRRGNMRPKLLVAAVVAMMAVLIALGLALMLGFGPGGTPAVTPEPTRPPAPSIEPITPDVFVTTSWDCQAHPAPSFTLDFDATASTYKIASETGEAASGEGSFMLDQGTATFTFTSGPLEGATAEYNAISTQPNLRFSTKPIAGFPDAARARCSVAD